MVLSYSNHDKSQGEHVRWNSWFDGLNVKNTE